MTGRVLSIWHGRPLANIVNCMMVVNRNVDEFSRKLKFTNAIGRNRVTMASIAVVFVKTVVYSIVLKQLAKHSRTTTMAPLIVHSVHFMYSIWKQLRTLLPKLSGNVSNSTPLNETIVVAMNSRPNVAQHSL